MTNIETATRNATAQSVRVIDTTPDALREAADRIEHMMREGYTPGDSVLCPLSPSVMLIHKPEKRPSAQLELATIIEGKNHMGLSGKVGTMELAEAQT